MYIAVLQHLVEASWPAASRPGVGAGKPHRRWRGCLAAAAVAGWVVLAGCAERGTDSSSIERLRARGLDLTMLERKMPPQPEGTPDTPGEEGIPLADAGAPAVPEPMRDPVPEANPTEAVPALETNPSTGADAGAGSEPVAVASEPVAVTSEPVDAGAAPVDTVVPLPPQDAGTSLPPELPLAFHALAGDRELTQQELTPQELWARLTQASAICLGEVHDSEPQHRVERLALEAVAAAATAEGRQLALGFEMFQKPFQPALTAFVQGQLDEEGLLLGTEYRTRWGYDFSFYRPLVEAARGYGLPALALNARAELTRAVGRGGLVALDEAGRAELPELNLEDAEHQAFVYGLLGALPEHGAELGLENIYVAQTIWDETMAESAATWLNGAGATGQILIFAGVAHCHESAIPRRITRRNQRSALSVGMLFASELELPDIDLSGYDLWIVLED